MARVSVDASLARWTVAVAALLVLAHAPTGDAQPGANVALTFVSASARGNCDSCCFSYKACDFYCTYQVQYPGEGKIYTYNTGEIDDNNNPTFNYYASWTVSYYNGQIQALVSCRDADVGSSEDIGTTNWQTFNLNGNAGDVSFSASGTNNLNSVTWKGNAKCYTNYYTYNCQTYCATNSRCLGCNTNTGQCTSCAAGWTGFSCGDDINDCANSPCVNGGTCSDCGTVCYRCSCPDIWTGQTCNTINGKAPTSISLSASSFNENSAVNTFIGTLSTVDPNTPQGDTFSYSLTNNAGGRVALSGANLVVGSTNTDYEATKSFTVTVRSTDRYPGTFVDVSFTINVNNVNEPPTDIGITSTTIAENTGVGATIGTLTAYDPDSTTFTYTLTQNPNNYFRIVAGTNQLQTNVNFDYETMAGPWAVTVRATDPGGLIFDKVFNIAITNVNEPPYALRLSATSVNENAASTAIGTLSASDYDAGSTFTYSLVSNPNGAFSISGSTLYTTTGLDYETTPSVAITLRVTDNGGLSYDAQFTITVINVNEAPTSIGLTATSVNENSPVGTVVGTASCVDPDAGQTLTISISLDAAGAFTFASNQLKLNVVPNFESVSSYSVTLRCVDQGNLQTTRVFTISINDVNEAPTALSLSQTSIAENNAVNAVIGTFTTSDPDSGESFTYTLTVGPSAIGIGAGGTLIAKSVFDYETTKSYAITVSVTDKGGLSLSQAFTISVTNVNEAPTSLTLSATSIAENNAAGATVAVLSSTDPDVGDTITYSLVSSTDSAQFSISGNLLKAAASFNFESKNAYDVTLQATDALGLFFRAAVRITVTDVNEAPTNVVLNGGSTGSVRENAAGAVVGTLTTADQDAGDTFTYTFASNPNNLFAISGSQLLTNVALDFETQPSLSVQIISTDKGGLQSPTRTFTISVTNVNEAPTSVGLSATSINENMAANSVVGVLSAIGDPDVGDTFTYQLVGNPSNSFAISGNNLIATLSFDYETTRSFLISVTVTDAGGLSATTGFTINVVDVNEAPQNILLSANTIAENSAANTKIGTFRAVDVDANESFTYTMTGDTTNAFTLLANGDLVLKRPLDFETQPFVDIGITAKDKGNLAVSLTFRITVTNVNEPPTGISLSASSIAENLQSNSPVGTFTVLGDPDVGDTFTCTITSTNFNLAGLQLRSSIVFNFEATSSYPVSVTCSDRGGLSVSNTFTISITDVNEPPTSISFSSSAIAENSATGTVVGTAQATGDPDAGATFTYSLASNPGNFFTLTSGQLKVAANIDFETTPTIALLVQATDNGGLSIQVPWTITVSNVNEVPTGIALSKTTVAENLPSGTVVATITTADPDAGNTFTYTVTGSALLSIQSNQLITTAALDYETTNTIAVTLKSTDQGGLFVSVPFTITVQDVNEPPTSISITATSISENNAANAAIGVLSGTDPDAGDALTYSLDINPGTNFAITGGQLVAAKVLDYETQQSFAVGIVATDKGGLTFRRTVTISVVNVNERPTSITLSALSVLESATVGTIIGTLGTVDPDVGDTFTYTLTGTTALTIAADGTLRTATALDFEATASYSITVTSKDAGGLTVQNVFTITVVDVNEPPTGITVTGLTIAENTPLDTVVIGTLATTGDPDRSETFTYSITVNPSNAFKITNNNQLAEAVVLNFEDGATRSISVRTTDHGGLFFTAALTVTVTDVNEPPTDISISSSSIAENSPIGSTVGTLSQVGDPDIGDAWTFTLTSNPDNAFAINGAALVTTVAMNFESKSSYVISVKVQDKGGLSFTKQMTITVLDVNEPPTGISISASTVDENVPANTVIGTFTTTGDPDAGETFRYSFNKNPSNVFAISGNTLVTAGAIDYEAQTSYTVGIVATDKGGLFVAIDFTIRVNNKNEAPTSVSVSSTVISEIAAIGSTVGTLSAADPDAGDTFTYTLSSNPQSAFDIRGTSLITKVIFDVSVRSSYSIGVTVTDAGGLTFVGTMTITVQAVDQTPSSLVLSASNILENAAIGTSIGTLTCTGAFSPDATVALSIKVNPSTSFSISGSALVSARVLDFEAQQQYSVTVTCKETKHNLAIDKIFTINVQNVNEAPTGLGISASTVAENSASGTVIGTLTTQDPDAGNTFTYTLTANPSNAFAIAGTTVKTNAVLDFEATPTITITVKTTDQDGLFFSKDIIITVTDVNEAPTGLTIDVSAVDENLPVGTVVGRLTTTGDPDANEVFTYAFAVATTDFTLDGNAVKTNAAFNFETKSSYSVSLKTTDKGGLSFTKAFTITVRDVNEPPTGITLSASSIAENNAVNAAIGTLAATGDPDAGDAWTFTVTKNPSSRFGVSGASLIAVQALDFEAQNSYTVGMTATDKGGLSVAIDFVVTVTDVNEAPTSVTLTGQTVSEIAPMYSALI
eukprot:Opistho-1_new@57081